MDRTHTSDAKKPKKENRHISQLEESEKDRKLQDIANSVTGFYKQPSLTSQHTYESKQASVQRAQAQQMFKRRRSKKASYREGGIVIIL